MCGINGIAYSPRAGRAVETSMLARMRDVLRHRGPDEEGIYIDNNIGLGHRRLSIVDLKSGQQPMFNADRSSVIVYNGEVYNHRSLRPYLSETGHEFQTNCDTETILRVYDEYGPECVHKLRGMFVFAIWDKPSKRLFIARDRLGVKPLYYFCSDDGDLYFASEIKALWETGAVKPELNFSALADYLANHGTSGTETLFRGVKRLPPGHYMTWSDGELQIEEYWDISFEPKIEDNGRSDADWTKEWLDLFKESVELRLMADVPLGMFLSGGIDSSAIAAVMSELVSDPIKTFSVAFAEREANELSYARLVAEKFRTSHHEVIVSPSEFFNALPSSIWFEDEPLAHPSSIALRFVSDLAAEHVKVVLTGEGSDESLAGYGRYAKTMMNLRYGNVYQNVLPEFVRRPVAGRIQEMSAASRVGHKLRKSFLAVKPRIEEMYFDNFAVFPRSMQSEMLSSSSKSSIGLNDDPYAEMLRLFDGAPSAGLLDRMLYTDTKTYLHELLMKQDQMSMSASLESRVPFLDHKLMEFSARMPDRMKIRGTTTKFVLRKAMEGLLPVPILTRGKMGFPVPIGKWFRGEWRFVVDEYVLSERTLSRGIFEAGFIRQLVAKHNSGENHDERLWALVNFEIWMRMFIDGESPELLADKLLQ